MRTAIGTVPTNKLVPPDIPTWDRTPSEEEQNRTYCEELQQAMYEYEMNPRNFFRLNKAR